MDMHTVWIYNSSGRLVRSGVSGNFITTFGEGKSTVVTTRQ